MNGSMPSQSNLLQSTSETQRRIRRCIWKREKDNSDQTKHTTQVCGLWRTILWPNNIKVQCHSQSVKTNSRADRGCLDMKCWDEVMRHKPPQCLFCTWTNKTRSPCSSVGSEHRVGMSPKLSCLLPLRLTCLAISHQRRRCPSVNCSKDS